jgi:TM2 domain-containing membrane protein YozV
MQPEVKNPALAAILSFLVNGLGQIYNGELVKGLIILGIQMVNLLLTMIFIGFITGPIVFIWCIYDAYTVAQRINREAQQQNLADTKVCSRCAERVMVAAKVCKHCGYDFEAAVQPN